MAILSVNNGKKLKVQQHDHVFVYFCINFVESESQMKAIIEYDLFNAQDAHAYKCSQKAVEAFYTLETIADDLEVWLANKTTSEGTLVDIRRIVDQWNQSNAS